MNRLTDHLISHDSMDIRGNSSLTLLTGFEAYQALDVVDKSKAPSVQKCISESRLGHPL